VSMQDMHQQLQRLDQQMHADALAEFKRVAAANARKSAQYMAQNRQRPGVVQLPSGIQYAVLSAGSGKTSPTVTSTVTVNYRGMLVDGTEFDSTWAHGAPVSFTVDKVIRGWQDVIPRMHVGDRWKVVIPPQLAYGETGALPRIGPNEALVFEIELLAIKPDTGKP
jgi:FKBP-type peptidyl-prolyl cis-trans isomerase FklB